MSLVGIGTSRDSVELSETSGADAFVRAATAMAHAGKILEADAGAGFLRGTTRYGLQKVRIKVTVQPSGDDSILNIEALADDVWGKGARSGIKRFREALGA